MRLNQFTPISTIDAWCLGEGEIRDKKEGEIEE